MMSVAQQVVMLSTFVYFVLAIYVGTNSVHDNELAIGYQIEKFVANSQK